jgi:transposase-like protein
LEVLKFVILQGLIKAVMELFPDSEHRFCVRHLYSNMNQLHREELVKNNLWTCARAISPARWEECMEAFKTECPTAHAWLDEMPPNTWARDFF